MKIVQVVFNTPERPEWGDLMAMTPRTVHSIKMGVNFSADLVPAKAHLPLTCSSHSPTQSNGEAASSIVDTSCAHLKRL